MNGRHPKVLGHRIADLHEEINRLRIRDGQETIGGLALAMKLSDHVKVEPNPRVAEAISNLSKAKAKVAAAQGQE